MVFWLFSSAGVNSAVLEKNPFQLTPFSESLNEKSAAKKAPLDGTTDKTAFSDSLGSHAEDRRQHDQIERQRNARAVTHWQRAVARQPANGNYHRRLAYALRKVRRFQEEIEVLQNAFRLNPVDASAYYELGACQYEQRNYREAAEAFEHSLWYRPSSLVTHRALADSLYYLARYHEAADHYRIVALKRREDFSVHYWLGISLTKVNEFEAAAEALSEAVTLRPNDFDANYQRGVALSRVGKFREAIPNLEKAMELRPGSPPTRVMLIGAYMGAGRFNKAFHLFRPLAIGLGLIFTGIYFVALCGAWWLSFRKNAAALPSIPLSLLWLFINFEGQAAFIFVPTLVPVLEGSSNLILSILFPGLPVLFAAVLASRKQKWGESFRWPLRFGGKKGIALAALFLILSFSFNALVWKILASDPSKRPIQKSMLLLKDEIASNPVLALFAIVVAIPLIEEVLFRGLLFTALRKRWRARWVIPATALLFALVHLDLPFLLPLFFLGLVLGWARASSESLGLPILLHISNNLLAMLVIRIVGLP